MIDTWFPTTIFRKDKFLENDENIKVYERIKKLNGVVFDGGKGWLSPVKNSFGSYNCSNDKELNFLHEKVSRYVNDFSKAFGCVLKAVCENSWFNYYEKGDYQEFHVHPMSHFSVVYIVKGCKESSPLIFASPYLNDMFSFPVEKPSEISFETVEYEATDNTIIIFRSNVPHMVPKNKSQERITMSFNYKLEEKE